MKIILALHLCDLIPVDAMQTVYPLAASTNVAAWDGLQDVCWSSSLQVDPMHKQNSQNIFDPLNMHEEFIAPIATTNTVDASARRSSF